MDLLLSRDTHPRSNSPLGRLLSWGDCEAGEGVRTLDIQLGRLTLYQLSYTRGERRNSSI